MEVEIFQIGFGLFSSHNLIVGDTIIDHGTRLVRVDEQRVNAGKQVRVDSTAAYDIGDCKIFMINAEDPDTVENAPIDQRMGAEWLAQYAAEMATYAPEIGRASCRERV